MLRSIKVLIKWWRTWGTLPVSAWVKGASNYRQGSFDEARKLYEEGLETHQSHPARYCAHMDLAYCLFKCRDFEGAERHLRHVVEHLPHSREASMRLARLQMWTGNHLEAAWTMKRLLEHAAPDAELVALFLMAVLQNGGPSYLRKEAMASMLVLGEHQLSHPKLEVARACLAIQRGEGEKGRAVLAGLACQAAAPLEAHIAFAEVLVAENKIGQARLHLRNAMLSAANHPRLLSLLAETYLQSGPYYNPDYANQLATSACQHTGWLSPREMQVLAQAFFHMGDKVSALIVASKAKDVGQKRLGAFKESQTLDELIQTLSSGTLA
jgi:uncharacterized protein HemY